MTLLLLRCNMLEGEPQIRCVVYAQRPPALIRVKEWAGMRGLDFE